MAAKADWHHRVEQERSLFNSSFDSFDPNFFLVPQNEVHETPDGKTIRIEYREENGTIYKVFICLSNQWK